MVHAQTFKLLPLQYKNVTEKLSKCTHFTLVAEYSRSSTGTETVASDTVDDSD